MWVEEWLISKPESKGISVGNVKNSMLMGESLYSNYLKWSTINGIEPIKINKFSGLLVDLIKTLSWPGVYKKRTSKGFIITGLELREEPLIIETKDKYLNSHPEISLGTFNDNLDFNIEFKNISEPLSNLDSNFNKQALEEEVLFDPTQAVRSENLTEPTLFSQECSGVQYNSLKSFNFLIIFTTPALNEIFNNFLTIFFSSIITSLIIFSFIAGAEYTYYKYNSILHKLKTSNNNYVIGFKKAYSVPSLPLKVEKIFNLIYVRVFRFIGGLSLVMVLLNYHLTYPLYIQKIMIILGSIQASLVLIIIFIKIIFGIYILIYKKEMLEVRNSPLNKYATQIAHIIHCAKIGCAVTGGAAGIIAAGASFDVLLRESGRKEVFVPFMGKILKGLFGEGSVPLEKSVEVLAQKTAAAKQPFTPSDQTSVSEMIEQYGKLSNEDKLTFLNTLNNDLKNRTSK